MSRDYKLNKSELSRLKRQEKLYCQYLPVLKLKLEQIQLEENRIRKKLSEALLRRDQSYRELLPYLPLFSDSAALGIEEILVINALQSQPKSVAGLKVRSFEKISFEAPKLPYFQSPPWLFAALPLMQRFLSDEAALIFLQEEQQKMRQELRKATRKVNLFDMVLIPHTKEAIKRIGIALGDEQVASVSRGKMAKSKKNLLEVSL